MKQHLNKLFLILLLTIFGCGGMQMPAVPIGCKQIVLDELNDIIKARNGWQTQHIDITPYTVTSTHFDSASMRFAKVWQHDSGLVFISSLFEIGRLTWHPTTGKGSQASAEKLCLDMHLRIVNVLQDYIFKQSQTEE